MDEEEDYFADREKSEIKFYEVKPKINRLLLPPISGPPSPALSTARNSNYRNSDDWTEVTFDSDKHSNIQRKFCKGLHFRDTFRALVLQNSKLRDVQRFQHLLSVLTEEAQQLIRNLPVTNDNFAEAWNLVS
jgi:hypothetical protein